MDAATAIREEFKHLPENEQRQFARWLVAFLEQHEAPTSEQLLRIRGSAAQLDPGEWQALYAWIRAQEEEALLAQIRGGEFYIYTPYESLEAAAALIKSLDASGAK